MALKKAAKLLKEQKGFTFIEVLMGVAIMGLIVAAFMLALVTAFKANMLAEVRTTADALARAQMEYIKAQLYKTASDGTTSIYSSLELSDTYSKYEIWSYDNGAEEPENAIIGIPWDSVNNNVPTKDIGLQKFTLAVIYDGRVEEPILVVEGYKAAR